MANQKQKSGGTKLASKTAVPKAKTLNAKTPVKDIYYLLFLLVLTIIVFFPSLSNNFISLDDYYYVKDNVLIRSLSSQHLKDIFFSPFFANYQPLTIFVYALEYHFFHLNPHAFHFVNLLLHLSNIVLVYYIINRIGKNQLVSFITALLFAVHPMHIESVAWVAELKDVLYSFFFLSAILFYLKYKETKKFGLFYILSLLAFFLSIMAKAQAVILPVALILIDIFKEKKINKNSILDKIPFFVMSLIFGVVTYQVQKGAGAMQDYGNIPFYQRIFFASYGLMNYFYKIILPINLSIFYPYPERAGVITSNWVYFSPVIVLLLAFILYKTYKTKKVIFFGIMFFLVTIFLVVQLLPVGDAVMADRYIYIPSIGLFFIAAYYFDKYLSEYKNMLLAGGILYISILCVVAFQRCIIFKDNLSVYTDAIEHNPSPTAYNNRGDEYVEIKDYQKAIEDFTECLKLKPNYVHALKNRGISYEIIKNIEMAEKDFEGEIQNSPNDPDSYINVGRTLKTLNRLDESEKYYTKAIEMHPSSAEAYLGRAETYGRRGMMDKAIDDLSTIIKLNPGDLKSIYANRGTMYAQSGKSELALQDFNKSIEMDSTIGNFYMNRSVTLKVMGNYAGSLNDALTAKRKGFNVDDNYIKDLEKIVIPTNRENNK